MNDDAAWLALLSHELRSPIAAILGYQELLEEGTFGELGPMALDAVRRTRTSARHLLALTDAIDRIAADPADFDEPVTLTDSRAIIDAVTAAAAEDAEVRSVTLASDDASLPVSSRVSEVCRSVELALSAAIKTGAGSIIHITAEPAADGVEFRISGTRLQLPRDDAHSLHDAAASGAALRILLARRSASLAGGSIRLHPAADTVTVCLEFPNLRD